MLEPIELLISKVNQKRNADVMRMELKQPGIRLKYFKAIEILVEKYLRDFKK